VTALHPAQEISAGCSGGCPLANAFGVLCATV